MTPVDDVESAGHFRIYLGAAAGVGKTYAMLNEGRRRRQRGADVVVALAEAHGRPLTEELLAGQEVLPRKVIEHRGVRLEEMDLDAVLERRPSVALVDELAHTNVPGASSHPKRWEDVAQLLGAGISVVTTLNVQHIESIADSVERITGVPVRERVPDGVVRHADQLELVDSSPEALRRRMLHGNIYPHERVQHALDHFFRTDNLAALRELALRFVADEIDDELLERLERAHAPTLWETTERVLVGVTAAPGTEAVMRRAARIARRAGAELRVVHVRGGDRNDRAGASMRLRLDELRRLAGDLGATWEEVDDDNPARALMRLAAEHQITQVVIGSSPATRWQELRGGNAVVRELTRLAADADVDVHVIARR